MDRKYTVTACGREEGMARLHDFLPRVPEYSGRRNYVDDQCSSVSMLSPWLNKGVISEAEVSALVLEKWSFAEAEKFLQEVYWRRYWRGYLSHRPQIWTAYRQRLTELRADEPIAQRASKIQSGDCAVEIMGYFARQLVETGYMHNHARMWFAAWWIHVERLPWELGADFFLEHLIDGDPAVNTLSWRWVAGLHTRGKSYLARRGNIERYVDPPLLKRYSGGLTALEDPVAQEVCFEEIPLCPQSHVASDFTGVKTLVAFCDSLDYSAMLEELNALGAEVCQLYIVSEDSVAHEFSARKVEWNKQVLAEVVRGLKARGLKVEVITLREILQHPFAQGCFALQKPEVGYFSDAYGAILDQFPQARPYEDETKTHLNSLAKAGFFTFWKKARKTLFPPTTA